MSRIHGFDVLRDEPLDEYAARAVLYRHARTGAQLLSLIQDDANKVFGVTFRTPPKTSTGVPHILEHSVLCGSRKYPVREPFVELLKGSLHTFLNAFTYPDKTCYPVASTNLRDFYNLIDVYLDAVFFPRISREVFLQEGWHYERDADGQLSRSGVVYNEMKGVYSSPDSVLAEFSQRLLFPDTTYGVDSGGDPDIIPTLTYEDFVAFHRDHYHPGNARFFFSGDDDPTERLRLLDAYCSAFEARTVDSAVPLQPAFDSPRHTTMAFAAAPGQAERGFVTVNWLLPEAADTDLVLVLDILEHVLIGLPTSPLRKALLDSRLGEDLAGGGLEDELRQMTFSTGLKGIRPEDARAVEDLIFATLGDLVRDGLPADAVEAGVNAVEFALRENNTGSFPRGLSLMLRALTTWLHDGDPLAPLRFAGPLARLKARLAAGEPVFEEAIRKYFLDNPHRVSLTLAPDTRLEENRNAAEKAALAQAAARMDAAERQRVAEDATALRVFQETPDSPEALATIPSLTLDDLPASETPIPQREADHGPTRLLTHAIETNGVFYLDLAFPLDGVPEALLPLVPLFGRAVLELGSDRHDPVALTRRIAAKTGGIFREAMVASLADGDRDALAARLLFRGKATLDKTADLLDILEEVLTAADFGNGERFAQMALEAKSRVERQLVPSGHATAAARLRARYTKAGYAAERLRGLSQLEYLRGLVERATNDYPSVRRDLEALREHILTRRGLVASLTAGQSALDATAPAVAAFLDRLPDAAPGRSAWGPITLPAYEGIAVPSLVHYVGMGLDLAKAGWTFDGADLVAVRYLRMAYLWDRVRVRGGAYGAFLQLDRFSGVAIFGSYRDPNAGATVDVFRETGRFLKEANLSDEAMTRAIIGAIGDIDSHLLPDAKGYVAMIRRLVGDTAEARHAMRQQVLHASVARFRELGAMMEEAARDASVVVVGPGASMDALAMKLAGLVRVDAL